MLIDYENIFRCLLKIGNSSVRVYLFGILETLNKEDKWQLINNWFCNTNESSRTSVILIFVV